MRIRFEDGGLRRLYEQPDAVAPGLGPEVTRAFRKKVGFVAAAQSELDLRNYRALRFKKLKGSRAGQHSIRLNRQWRLILRKEEDASGPLLIIVEIDDYH